jgi:hypothetical protein
MIDDRWSMGLRAFTGAVARRALSIIDHRSSIIVALIFAPAPLLAQATVAAVVLERRSIFDPDESRFWLLNLVNRLHITTLPYVVRREVLLHPGEPYDSAKIAESERNLRRLGVFRSVKIDTSSVDSGLVVTVTTRDGWSTRPDFRFGSTGGQVVYTLALIEDNLLGTATQTSLLYRKNPDRTTTTLAFRQPRLIGGTIGMVAALEDRSDGQLAAGTIGKSFFNLGAKSAWSITGDTRRERILRFRDGIEQATDTLQRRYVLGRAEVARALRTPSLGYVRAGLVAQLRRDDFTTQATFDNIGITERSVTGAVGGWIEARKGRYVKLQGYNSLSRDEDVDLSTVVRASLLLAPSVFGYEKSGIAPAIAGRTGHGSARGFSLLEWNVGGMITSSGLDSATAQVAATAAWIPSPKHLALVHASGGVLRGLLPGSEFDLGLGAGPRAFRSHAFTGDRAFFVTAEYRYGAAVDFLKVMDVGIATFVDHGGAWYRGATMRTGWDMGVGLRLGASRAPDLEANRMDLVYRVGNDREASGWVFVVGKGFTFSTGLRGGR